MGDLDYAVIKDGVVKNVIVIAEDNDEFRRLYVEDGYADELRPVHDLEVRPSIGWTVDGNGNFTAPPPPEPPPDQPTDVAASP